MHRKFLLSLGVLLMLAFAAAALAAIVLPTTTFRSPQGSMPNPSGATPHSVALAREQGMPASLVKMAPQSSLKLLARATKLGPHAPKSPIELTVSLKLRNVAQLKTFLRQVQNPASPRYHQWLTPAEFTRRYGPTKDDVAQIVAFLESRGIAVTDVAPNRMLIQTRATTTVYEHALGVQINDYELEGRRFFSTTDRPMLPRAIAPLVVNVLGLDRGVQLQPHSYSQPMLDASALTPYQAPAPSLTYLSPLQIAHAYNYPDITDQRFGLGVNVAILTASSSGLASLSDPHDFWAAYGLPDHVINVIPVADDQGDTSGMTETLLDIDYAGAMGPGATLNVYVSPQPSLGDMITMYNMFTNDTKPDGTARNQVMTTSWGAPETSWGTLAETADQAFMQGAAEGISMFAAAGDYGSGDGTSLDNVSNYPSSSPYIAAANGTQLNISDLQGTYGSETTWNDASCFGRGPMATGGAVSRIFDKPVWQHGAGVPTAIDMRMNSDMAATASCTKPMVILANGQWGGIAGTSAVAPQFAGLFSIAVAQHGGEPLGQANALIYQVANAHYVTDFHDVTTGNNGAFQAGPDWDHPTGWGSPNVKRFLSHIGVHGPQGTLAGTVTASADGSPIAGAIVKAVGPGTSSNIYKTTTQNDGSYTRALPAGTFSVTVIDLGYRRGTAAVTIGNGQTTTRNFSLDAAAQVTLSGKISDASGHGYGLLAHLTLTTEGFGQIAKFWTDPDGSYSITVPDDITYTLDVAAAFNGYKAASKTFLMSGNTTQNIRLSVTTACTAPGYKVAAGGLNEDFNGENFPPSGWTVENPIGGSPVFWKLNSDWGDDNWTGATGTAAEVSSGHAGPGYTGPHDSSLVTPAISVSSLNGFTVLHYKANFASNDGNDTLDLDISTDNGATWSNILHWNTDHGEMRGLPGESVNIDMRPFLPTSGSFKLRWHDHDLNGQHWDYYAQIDDVALGNCVPVAGGIVYGQVIDTDTGSGLAGATVSDDTGTSTQTLAQAMGPSLPVGSYIYFTKDGNRTLTASKPPFSQSTKSVTVPKDAIVASPVNFDLKPIRFEASPSTITLHVRASTSATTSFALKNTNSGAGIFKIMKFEGSAPHTGALAQTAIRIPVTNPAWLGKSLPWIREHSNGGQFRLAPSGGLRPHESGWQAIASYPIATVDGRAAIDPDTGKLYVVGGVNVNGVVTKDGFVYDPGTGSWSPIADAPEPREAGAIAFINGKLYLAGGWDAGAATATLDIYDPATNSWTTGASAPTAQGGGVGYATTDGKFYLIGGCNDGSCSKTLNIMQVYDPVTDSWSTATDYPKPVAWASCGGVQGKIYCAGSLAGNSITGTGFVYASFTNTWSPIADMKNPQAAAMHAAANGLLLVAGGADATASIVNTAEAYDPVTNSWTTLPTLNTAVFRGAGACGFYQVGGVTSITSSGATLTNGAEVLPGYDQKCGESTSVPWLTVAPTQGTLAGGTSTQIHLTIDGAGRTAGTTSKAYLRILGGTSGAFSVPITVNWEAAPPKADLSVTTSDLNLKKGATAKLTMTVSNAGPDPATAVVFTLQSDATSIASLESVSTQTGSCNALAVGYSCELDNLPAGASATITASILGVSAGDTSIVGEANTSAEDDDGNNNRAVAAITVSKSDNGGSGGGGGALDWPLLAGLLGLSLIVVARRRDS